MFHGIGKILNAKRYLDAGTDRSKLPSHFGDNLTRLPLIEELPEKVVEICELNSQQFLDFLHENAIDFYLDIEAAANSLEFISLGDRMNNWMFDSGADYATSSACRGYLFANPRVAKAWRPIRKSQFDWQLCKRRIEVIKFSTVYCILNYFLTHLTLYYKPKRNLANNRSTKPQAPLKSSFA